MEGQSRASFDPYQLRSRSRHLFAFAAHCLTWIKPDRPDRAAISRAPEALASSAATSVPLHVEGQERDVMQPTPTALA